MSEKRFDQFPAVTDLLPADILVGWKTSSGINIKYTFGDLVRLVVANIALEPRKINNSLVVDQANTYILSNGSGGLQRFYKLECDDYGNLLQPLQLVGAEPGYSTAEDLITYLNTL